MTNITDLTLAQARLYRDVADAEITRLVRCKPASQCSRAELADLAGLRARAQALDTHIASLEGK